MLLTNFLAKIPTNCQTTVPLECRENITKPWDWPADCCQTMFSIYISRFARAWAIPISHLIIIILDFPSGESSISIDKQGYDPRQVKFLTRPWPRPESHRLYLKGSKMAIWQCERCCCVLTQKFYCYLYMMSFNLKDHFNLK